MFRKRDLLVLIPLVNRFRGEVAKLVSGHYKNNDHYKNNKNNLELFKSLNFKCKSHKTYLHNNYYIITILYIIELFGLKAPLLSLSFSSPRSSVGCGAAD